MNTFQRLTHTSDRKIFAGLLFIGMAACTAGIGKAPVYGWLHPISLLGYLLGGLALLLGLAVLLRRYTGPIRDDRAAVFALLSIMVVKFVLAALYPLIP